MTDFAALPPDLPVPLDDGAADHLAGMRLPALVLPATRGGEVDLAAAAAGAGRLVLYVYPRTGTPGQPSPDGWDAIPGARGCTPQSCAFRDHHAELRAVGAEVLGLSAQPAGEQAAFAAREHLPFALLSDSQLRLAAALRLPTFEAGGMRLYKRITLVVEDGAIAKAFHPVFPPDRNAAEVLAWLRERDRRRAPGALPSSAAWPSIRLPERSRTRRGCASCTSSRWSARCASRSRGWTRWRGG